MELLIMKPVSRTMAFLSCLLTVFGLSGGAAGAGGWLAVAGRPAVGVTGRISGLPEGIRMTLSFLSG
jgi:hypothetical protein